MRQSQIGNRFTKLKVVAVSSRIGSNRNWTRSDTSQFATPAPPCVCVLELGPEKGGCCQFGEICDGKEAYKLDRLLNRIDYGADEEKTFPKLGVCMCGLKTT